MFKIFPQKNLSQKIEARKKHFNLWESFTENSTNFEHVANLTVNINDFKLANSTKIGSTFKFISQKRLLEIFFSALQMKYITKLFPFPLPGQTRCFSSTCCRYKGPNVDGDLDFEILFPQEEIEKLCQLNKTRLSDRFQFSI